MILVSLWFLRLRGAEGSFNCHGSRAKPWEIHLKYVRARQKDYRQNGLFQSSGSSKLTFVLEVCVSRCYSCLFSLKLSQEKMYLEFWVADESACMGQ